MQKRCPNCMSVVEEETKCPDCGFDISSADNKDALKVGSVFKERYLIGRIFSKNNLSTVYIGYDQSLNSKVFVREFTGEGLLGDDMPLGKKALVERFLNYQRSVASVSLCDLFPRTVDLFAFEDKGYLVTEFFEGQSLKEILSGGMHISEGNALKIIDKLANGLKVLHGSHMLYGALSPDTLYILKDGGVKLFGMGSPFYDFLEDIDKKVEFLNPSYAAPELFESDAGRGSFCDVYSLAAILYRLLTDTIPPVSFLRSGGESLVKPRKINGEIESSVEVAILNALNWQIEKRTSSAERFLKELPDGNVKRRRSFVMLWAEFLGFCQRIYDKRALSKEEKNEAEQTEKRSKERGMLGYLWIWITLPIIALLAVVLVLVIMLPKSTDDTSSLSGESEDGWYYGSGIETPNNSSDYEPASRKPVSSATSSNSSITSSLGQDQTECPDVLAYTLSHAKNILESSDLKLGTVTYEYSDDYPEGYVMSQNVDAGAIVKKGRSINIVVSKGRKPDNTVSLPSVTGKDLITAENELKAAGITNIKYSFVSGNEAAGTVTKIEASDEAVNSATTVTLTVVGERADVRDYTGMTLNEVMHSASDFKIVTVAGDGNTIEISEAGYDIYEVTGQNLPSGTVGYVGMELVLTVKIK